MQIDAITSMVASSNASFYSENEIYLLPMSPIAALKNSILDLLFSNDIPIIHVLQLIHIFVVAKNNLPKMMRVWFSECKSHGS